MKILLCAYACSPYKGSEPGVGWGVVSAMAHHHDLWVIVEEEKFRPDIERWIAKFPELEQSVHFYFVRKKRNRTLRKLWPPSYYWYYRQWHSEVLYLAQKLHDEVGFDLIHQLTMVGFREPGYLWTLGIPFVWGPVGGMGLFPWRFLPVVGAYGVCYYLGYNLFNWLQMNFLVRPRQAARVAASGPCSGLIAATHENSDGAVKCWGCASTVLAEVGLPREPVLQIRERGARESLRLVWSGQHTPGKALNLALQAISKAPAGVNWELHILGMGRQTDAWQRLAERLGISGRCHFHGWVQREQALDLMQSAHAMLITSLRDLTSTVTIEALALGLPIICLDHCGFSNVVDDSCGIKIPLVSPQQVVRDMAGAVLRIARNEDYRQTLAKGALRRAEDFSWERKAEQMNDIYQNVMAQQ